MTIDYIPPPPRPARGPALGACTPENNKTPPPLSPKSAEPMSAILLAYAETCRHIEALEKINSSSDRIVLISEANARARLLLERILER